MVALALRVAVRSWKRALLVAVALTIAAIIFGYYRVMIEGMGAQALAMTVRHIPPGNTLAHHSVSFPAGFSESLEGVEAVTAFWLVQQRSLWARQGSVSLLTFDFREVFGEPTHLFKAGSLPQAVGQVVITEHVGEVHGLTVGSIVHVEGGIGYEVVGVLREGLTVPVPFGPQSSQLYLYEQSTERGKYNRAYIFVSDTAPKESLGVIETIIETIVGNYGGMSLSQGDFTSTPLRSFVSQLVLMMSFLVLIATALLQVNMLAISLMSAKREISAMRAFGMTYNDIGLFSFFEAVSSGIMAIPLIWTSWILVFPHIVPTELHHLMQSGLLLGLMVGCLFLSALSGLTTFRVIAGFGD